MEKQIVIINNKKFLVQSVLKLSTKYQVLGFWETTHGWSKHVQSIELSHEEWSTLSAL